MTLWPLPISSQHNQAKAWEEGGRVDTHTDTGWAYANVVLVLWLVEQCKALAIGVAAQSVERLLVRHEPQLVQQHKQQVDRIREHLHAVAHLFQECSGKGFWVARLQVQMCKVASGVSCARL